MVRDGQVYQEQVRLKKRLPDKTLTMKWEVFRDKLRPGQKGRMETDDSDTAGTGCRGGNVSYDVRCLRWIRYGIENRISVYSIIRSSLILVG